MQSREEMRKAFQERMKKGGASSGFAVPMKPGLNIWSPQNGKHIIDIIPYYAGKNDPFVQEGESTYLFEYRVHENAGASEGRRICPLEMWNEPCPICEERRKLSRQGADDDVLKRLTVKKYSRTLYNIICYDSRDQESKGIQIFDTSFWLLEMYLRPLAERTIRPGDKKLDPYIYFSDLAEGRSIIFTKEGAKDSTKYIGIKFEERDYELDASLMKKANTLDEIIIKPTYDDLCDWYFGPGEKEAAGMRGNRTETGETESFKKPRRTEADDNGGGERQRAREPEKAKDPECPEGYDFGEVDQHKACKKCEEDVWQQCAKAASANGNGKKKDEDEVEKQDPPPDPPEETTGRRRRGAADDEVEKQDPPEETGRRRRGAAEDPEPAPAQQEETTGRRRRASEDDDPPAETRRRRRE